MQRRGDPDRQRAADYHIGPPHDAAGADLRSRPFEIGTERGGGGDKRGEPLREVRRWCGDSLADAVRAERVLRVRPGAAVVTAPFICAAACAADARLVSVL